MIFLTHIDLDGAGCEVVARFFYPEEELRAVYHVDYDTVDKESRKILESCEEQLVFADLAMTKETAEWIHNFYPGRVELFDHHKTSMESLKDYPWAHFDLSSSGTKLLFNTLRQRMPEKEIPDGLANFVFYVNDYDLWIHESPMSRLFNDMLNMLGMPIFVKMMIERISNGQYFIDNTDRLYLDGAAHYKKKYFQDRVRTAMVDGNRLVLVASRYISELSQYIRDISPAPEEWKDVEYIDIINLDNQTHSLRNYKNNFDVSDIAKNKGGGGHPQAAGFPVVFPEKDWFLKF